MNRLVLVFWAWALLAINASGTLNQKDIELISTPVKTNTADLRDLSTCSSKLTCSECTKTESCAWLNSSCEDDPEKAIVYRSFRQSEEYLYCKDLPKYNSLKLSEDHRFKMTHNSNADVVDHNLCSWIVRVDPSETLNVIIKRSSRHKEDIVLTLYDQMNQKQYVTSNDLATCSGEELNVKYSDVNFIKVRSQILTDNPSYAVYIDQGVAEEDVSVLLMVMCSILGLIVLSIAALFIIYFACFTEAKRRRRHLRRAMIQQKESYIKAKARTVRVMDSMKHGAFKDMEVVYSEDACVVCLNEFEDEDLVHITNECKHIFHSACLKQWYHNVGMKKDLCCPHCNQVNNETDQIPDHGVLKVVDIGGTNDERQGSYGDISSQHSVSEENADIQLPPINNIPIASVQPEP